MMTREKPAPVAEQFDNAEQQLHAATLGMWVFLATEVLFFGGLFLAYLTYHSTYPSSFIEGSHHLEIVLGGINTALLLTSSFSMVLAVHFAREIKKSATFWLLLATIILGLCFLALKSLEYYHHYLAHEVPGPAFQVTASAASNVRTIELFFFLYFAMTGLHALHMTVGVGVLSVLAYRTIKSRHGGDKQFKLVNAVDMAGLYWHFVDIVWIFLFPLFYLLERYK